LSLAQKKEIAAEQELSKQQKPTKPVNSDDLDLFGLSNNKPNTSSLAMFDPFSNNVQKSAPPPKNNDLFAFNNTFALPQPPSVANPVNRTTAKNAADPFDNLFSLKSSVPGNFSLAPTSMASNTQKKNENPLDFLN
jgi:hypothetical protein